MPRPGPRPYECVRRAWHSDRHQPMRGSLIREIFGLVSEIHSPATKKNKEWQEKLPIVVLKTEEIMYSKANSEAEYLDLKTLWERTDDAINTIIRRDESIETGDLLQPCIEAALNLGCIPRRASRSQRHNTPKYLSPSTQEVGVTTDLPRMVAEQTAYGVPQCLLPRQQSNPIPNSSPQFIPYYPTLVQPAAVNLSNLGTESYPPHQTASCNVPCHERPPMPEKRLHHDQDSSPQEMNLSPPICHTYPLYHGPTELIYSYPVTVDKTSLFDRHVYKSNAPDSSNRMIQSPLTVGLAEDNRDACFDLSLQLAPLTSPGSSLEKQGTRGAEDRISGRYHESVICDLSLRTGGGNPSHLPRQRGNQRSMRMDDLRLNVSSSRWVAEGERPSGEMATWKGKAPEDSPDEDCQIYWQNRHSSS